MQELARHGGAQNTRSGTRRSIGAVSAGSPFSAARSMRSISGPIRSSAVERNDSPPSSRMRRGLLAQDLDVLTQDGVELLLDDRRHLGAPRERDLPARHQPEARAEVAHRRVRQRADQVAPAARPVLDLRDAGQEEAVPVLGHDRLARRRRASAPESGGSPMYSTSMPPGMRRRTASISRLLLAAEVAAVHERGVRHVERVLERRVQRALDVVLAQHRRGSRDRRRAGCASARRAARRRRGPRPRRSRPARGVANAGTLRPAAVSLPSSRPGTSRHVPRAVEAPAVVRAGEVARCVDRAERERRVAVRAAVEQRGGARPRASRNSTIGRSKIVRAIGASRRSSPRQAAYQASSTRATE